METITIHFDPITKNIQLQTTPGLDPGTSLAILEKCRQQVADFILNPNPGRIVPPAAGVRTS